MKFQIILVPLLVLLVIKGSTAFPGFLPLEEHVVHPQSNPAVVPVHGGTGHASGNNVQSNIGGAINGAMGDGNGPQNNNSAGVSIS